MWGNLQHFHHHHCCWTKCLYWHQLWDLAYDLSPSAFQHTFADHVETIHFLHLQIKYLLGWKTSCRLVASSFWLWCIESVQYDEQITELLVEELWNPQWNRNHFLQLLMIPWKGCGTCSSLINFPAGHTIANDACFIFVSKKWNMTDNIKIVWWIFNRKPFRVINTFVVNSIPNSFIKQL